MGVFGILLFTFGAFYVAAATECVPETAKCSEYWEKILPHKNLISSEAELNSWCSKQARFYQCLEDVLLEGKNGNLSYLPTNLLISKLFSQDLCSDGSKSRIRLLNNADCINELNTDFCILPEYLDIVSPDDDIPSTRCSQAEKTFSCIAATMVLNCGFDAGRVYRTMLKITRYSDEICGIETSEGIPPCEGSKSKSTDRHKLSEMYYGLFHRMGDMLDPAENEIEKPVSNEVVEQSDDINEVVTEAIQAAIDNLEENLIAEELDIPEYGKSTRDFSSLPCSKDVTEHKPYMKNPIITEVFKEFLFYNYSDKEYALYWRQPLFSITDRMDCDHLYPSYMKVQIFRCRLDYRYSDPDCLSNVTAYEKLTPEFIRSFDSEVPCDSTVEFGPRPEWMSDVDKMYEDKRIRDQTTSTLTPTVTEAPEALTTCTTLLHIAGTMCPKTETSTKWYEYNFEANNLNAPIPNELYYELRNLVWPDVESFQLPMDSIKVGDSMFVIMYDPKFARSMENITCSRLDECRPGGRGLWKCKVFPRQIQTCDTCGVYPTGEPDIGVETYARPATSEATFTVPEEIEPTISNEESSMVQNSAPVMEEIALVFSGDSESENEIEREQTEDLMNVIDSAMSDEAVSDDDDAEFKENEVEYNLLSDSDIDDVQLQILNRVLNGDEDSESSEVVYTIQGNDEEDDESQVVIATKDELLSGNILVIRNASDLEEAGYTVVSMPTAESI